VENVAVAGMVQLMDYHVEAEDGGHGVNFKLATPCVVLTHFGDVFIEDFGIVIHECSIFFRVAQNLIDCQSSIFFVVIFVTL